LRNCFTHPTSIKRSVIKSSRAFNSALVKSSNLPFCKADSSFFAFLFSRLILKSLISPSKPIVPAIEKQRPPEQEASYDE
jgi:hypothetical protein